RGYISSVAYMQPGICTPEFHRDRGTPRACFLLSFVYAHLNYGGAYGGAERLAGR
ncbi:TPA: hypothetical protein G8M18_005789, partial [Salmonella enterica]|nr:hypothetical protein [Salmonella enterica]